MCKFEGTLGEDFIALELILDWEGKGCIAREAKFSPLLDPSFTNIAMSNKGHSKVENLIQVLYVNASGANTNGMN